ncbi:DUF6285 domain-containing protein [Actinocorallia populi]|uniref:DUF6285 domain-containing protein n=1 Tax=Actinocorallia populi TaxID=2079200 RepID=UPI000D09466D|nr:DUF6285 domain-containing protein [Actinocorallia populi]
MPGPHDVPAARGLVEAVREFLERDVLPEASGRRRFHALVAANLLTMVERELELGPAQAEEHRERLAALGFGSDAELARAIRAGELDGRYGEVRAALLEAVAAKLAVANPAYPAAPEGASAISKP